MTSFLCKIRINSYQIAIFIKVIKWLIFISAYHEICTLIRRQNTLCNPGQQDRSKKQRAQFFNKIFHFFPTHLIYCFQYTLPLLPVSNHMDLLSVFLYDPLGFEVLKFSRHGTAVDT